MRDKRFVKAFYTILLAITFLFPSTSFADADRIFKENNNAVVVIVTYDKEGKPISQGSGFIVRQDGAIITNYHVISDAEDIAVKAGTKTLKVEGLLYIDKENDIVILKSTGEKFQTVKIGDIDKINVGEKIYVISSPQGLENTISDGILSGIREIDSKRKILQITAPISEGSSGGPVFNKNGEVIGIATFLLKEAQNLNFAMPVNLIKGKIGTKKVTALRDSEIEDYKKTAEYWFVLGYYLDEAGMYREEIEAFKQAIRIKPDYAKAHCCLGIVYNKLGMYREAIEAYKQAIRIKPDYAEAHSCLGIVYDKLGMHREAIEAYKQAIRIKPDYTKAHHILGIKYGELGMYKEAIEAFKQAIRIKPDFAEAHYRLGLIYYFLNNRGMALEQYKILKKLDPELAEDLFNLIYK